MEKERDAGGWRANPHLSAAVLTPIEERMAAERPALCEGLSRLRAEIGEAAYEKHVAGLANLTRSGDTLLVVAGDFMKRSLLERALIPQMKAAFGVRCVRVVV